MLSVVSGHVPTNRGTSHGVAALLLYQSQNRVFREIIQFSWDVIPQLSRGGVSKSFMSSMLSVLENSLKR